MIFFGRYYERSFALNHYYTLSKLNMKTASSDTKAVQFFNTYDFDLERIKDLTPGKTTSKLNYLSFDATINTNLQLGGNNENSPYLYNVFTDNNSNDVGIGIIYNDANLTNFRTIFDNKLKAETGIQSLKNTSKDSKMTLTFTNNSTIWFKEQSGKLNKITSKKNNKLIEFFKRHADLKTTCHVIASYNGGTIFPHQDEIYHQEEWTISTIYLQEQPGCKNVCRDWISVCNQPSQPSPKIRPLIRPAARRDSSLSSSNPSGFMEKLEKQGLEDKMADKLADKLADQIADELEHDLIDLDDDAEENHIRSRLSDLDISLTLNKSVLKT